LGEWTPEMLGNKLFTLAGPTSNVASDSLAVAHR
jgi:hypothetical protein